MLNSKIDIKMIKIVIFVLLLSILMIKFCARMAMRTPCTSNDFTHAKTVPLAMFLFFANFFIFAMNATSFKLSSKSEDMTFQKNLNKIRVAKYLPAIGRRS